MCVGEREIGEGKEPEKKIGERLMLEYRFVRKLGKRIQKCADSVIERFRNNLISEEEHITSQLASKITDVFFEDIKQSLVRKRIGKVNFEVKIYKAKGPKSEEKDIGADIGGVVEIDFPDYQVKKAYLAQAKLCKIRQGKYSSGEFVCQDPKLQEQCEKMLKITPDSFVFLYSTKGVLVAPAISVMAVADSGKATSSIPIKSYGKSIGTFYEEFVKSFIGDSRIAKIIKSTEDLKRFAEEYKTESVLFIKALSNQCTESFK